ncbi:MULTISPECIES: hypothetical protein [unclassified Pseudomonas]|uniref:hypothetical protein n=1 Tax=unclassified Pseudomonas TaxID=196821 RepID=UPI0008387F69|nr:MULTISPECIES: hypothetical protein [unclassified Pseudomonas]QIH09590.1 hypothetical protein ATY02_24210 [Pseudomonas sp. BIOMIG1BAC]
MTQPTGSSTQTRAGKRRHLQHFLLRLTPVLLLGFGLFTPTAQANPTTTYRGTLGDTPVELALTYDSQYGGGMSGYWFSESERLPMALESTPFHPGSALLINIMDNPTLPATAVSLQPFAEGAEALQGSLVDLRTGTQQPLQLQRVTRFGGSQREAFEGELLQPVFDRDFYFSVHAARKAGEEVALVDSIRVISRNTGKQVQDIRGQWCLSPVGTQTLTFGHFQAEARMDFRAQSYRLTEADGRQWCAPTQYYLFYRESRGYLRHPQMEQFAADGDLRFSPSGQMEFSKQDFIDYDKRTRRWDFYRVISPERLQYLSSGEERF